uniref:Uncharacterized protein n=1 Tax=Monodelphis domestica TaxID=13616 RepID=A0A5F8G7U1_MONDO
MLLAGVFVEPGAFVPVLFPVPPLPLLPVGHVHDDQQRGAGDEDELQGPQADVGDGEEVIVADIGAAGLACIAVKILLLIPPHALRRHHVDQHAEDEDQGEPDAAESCRILIDAAQQILEDSPVHRSPKPGLALWVRVGGVLLDYKHNMSPQKGKFHLSLH